MTETDFQAGVIEYARLTGWRTAHFRPAMTDKGWRTPVAGDGKGFPDLVLVHEKRGLLLVRELKSDRGRLTPEQDLWLKALASAGVDVGVWRPKDLPEIEAVLGGKRQREREAA